MGTFLQNVRYGFRALAKSPGFAVIAILTLALGIGANAAIFSVVNGLFLHPPGVARPDRVVVERVRYLKLGLTNIVVSAPDFAQVRDSKNIFQSAALEDTSDFNYSTGDFPERLRGAKVSWQFSARARFSAACSRLKRTSPTPTTKSCWRTLPGNDGWAAIRTWSAAASA
jgi:hypothetical protein